MRKLNEKVPSASIAISLVAHEMRVYTQLSKPRFTFFSKFVRIEHFSLSASLLHMESYRGERTALSTDTSSGTKLVVLASCPLKISKSGLHANLQRRKSALP